MGWTAYTKKGTVAKLPSALRSVCQSHSEDAEAFRKRFQEQIEMVGTPTHPDSLTTATR